MTLQFYRHLRIGFMLLWLVAWNVLLGLGILLDGGASGASSKYFSVMFAVALLGTSGLCLAVLRVPGLQALALRPESTLHMVRRDLWFMVLLGPGLALVAIAGQLLGAPSA